MATQSTDLRDGMPGHAVSEQNRLRREQDAKVSREPQVVAPEPGKNVPEGQNTKG
ncbi:MAG: hypothetical protein JOZ72_09995 [Alphaproteobacteria bacterium]|nr:hypothetical protein [Alphaproteobacteria bacterium]